ncbi:FK506-binding protein 5-like [Argopecten irradians]|uniref:FK506-binding protein 5-like n=1 Tax=Argopecten irradians TaxID=31199 RepID=UPI0037236586
MARLFSRDFSRVAKAPYSVCESIMESITESPSKKMICKMRLLKKEIVDSLAKGREIALEIKHIVKDRLACESSQLQLMEKQNNATLQTLSNGASNFAMFDNFTEKYQAYMKSSVTLQQDFVTKLREVNGPYEMIKRWLDSPTTKSRPDDLKKQYSFLCDDHSSKLTLLKKEKKTLTKLREQLTTCQKKLETVQATLHLTIRMDVEVSARDIKEQRTLRGVEKDLITRLNKSLKQCQALVIEEAESRKNLLKGMTKIAAEIESFEEERVKVCNAAMSKFASILNQQELLRNDKEQSTLDMMSVLSPTFIDPRKVSMKSKEDVYIYKFPDIAGQLKEIGFSQSTLAPEPVYRDIVESEDTTNKDGEISEKDEDKKSSRVVRNRYPTPDVVESQDQPKQARKVRKPVLQEEQVTTVQKLNGKTSPEPVESEKKPRRKLPCPPQDSDDDAPPPRVTMQGWVNNTEEKVSVKVKEQDISHIDPSQYTKHGEPLEQSRPLKALVTHSSEDNTYLSYKKGQKLVQTHKENEEGIAYGHTRKHSYGSIKYGYFSIRQMRTWKPTAKNILKDLF